jgi:hypothetical protein
MSERQGVAVMAAPSFVLGKAASQFTALAQRIA